MSMVQQVINAVYSGKFRPSNLPMLSKCARFTGKPSEHTEAGTIRHKALELYLKGNKQNELLMSLDEQQQDGVIWAGQYVIRTAKTALHKINYEQKCTYVFDDFQEFSGTMDVECGPDIWDLKWRRRDYMAQFAAYALTKLETGKFETVRVHALFAERMRYETYDFTLAQAKEIVEGVRVRAESDAPPTPCEYCNWCANRVRCTAYTQHVAKVVEGYSDGIKQWHPSKMEDATEIAAALILWRKIVEPWGRSLEFHALNAAEKLGLQLPGFDLDDTRPKQVCTDMAGAYNVLGIPQEDFLKASAGLRLKTSKDYADRVGIVNLYAKINGMKFAPAQRKVKELLAPFMDTGKTKKKLTSTDSETETTEEGEE